MTLLLALTLLAGVSLGNASQYGFVGDPYDNVGQFACQGRLQARYGTRTWRTMRDHGVAHRTLPCGTIVALRANPSRVAFCAVLDRGPWCRVGPGCKRSSRASGEGFEGSAELPYRGDLDLSPAVAERVGIRLHGGPGRVRVTYWPVARVRRERGGNS